MRGTICCHQTSDGSSTHMLSPPLSGAKKSFNFWSSRPTPPRRRERAGGRAFYLGLRESSKSRHQCEDEGLKNERPVAGWVALHTHASGVFQTDSTPGF